MGINSFRGIDHLLRGGKESSGRRGKRTTQNATARRNRLAALATAGFEQLEDRSLFAADVVISEIMYHPLAATPRDEVRQEYIELYNKGNATANLTGWAFTSGVNFTFPNVSIAAGQYLVIAADISAFNAKYPSVSNVIGGWYNPAVVVAGSIEDLLSQKKLSDGGEKITLQDAAGTTISSVSYANQGDDWSGRQPGPLDSPGNHYGWTWYSPADGGGRSLELINPAVSNALGQNWGSSSTVNGTPGGVNSVNSANIAPLITDMQQFPVLPKSTDTVTITAKISDELASGFTASVKYRVDGTANFQTATMFDDGLHNDGHDGDGVFGGTLPAQNNLTVIEFYITATDAANNTREYPKPGVATQQATSWHPAGYAAPRAVYQVNNAYVNPATWTPGTLQTGYVIMTAAEKAELDAIFGGGSSLNGPNSRMAGTFINIDGTGVTINYDVGIRNRGHGSRSGPPNNFDVGFTGDDWNGQGNLVLNKDTYPSQIAGAAIFAMADIETFNAQGFTLFYNGSAQGGLAQRAAQEAPDGNFTSNHFGADGAGNLYTMQRDFGSADFSYLGESPTSYYPGYIKQSNVSLNDYSDLIAMIKKLNNLDASNVPQPAGAGYLASISGVVNVNQWLRYLAINMLVSNKESGLYTGVGDDYQAYRGIADPRFVLVPHDFDSIMGIAGGGGASPNEDVFGPYLNLTAFNKFLLAPEIIPLYYQTILDVIKTTFNNTVIDPVLDRVLAGVSGAQTATMKSWIAARAAGAAAQIQQNLSVVSPLAITSGYPRTTSPTASFTGTGNAISTRSVLVNGQLTTWNARTGTWSISGVTLNPGINRVLVQTMDGYAGLGNEVVRTTIDIWYDDSSVVNAAGFLPVGTTTWTSAAGPYRVTGDLTIPAGSTLVIQPGTSVYFDTNAKLIVNGTLTAVATDRQHIRLTKTPGNVSNWGGIQFINSSTDNQLGFFDQEFGDSSSQSIQLTNSQLTMNRGNWLNTTKQILNTSNSSFNLTNSTLPAVTNVEMVHVVGVPVSGFALVQGNSFGATSGKFDVIGITGGNRPSAIVQILDNTFSGSGDDILDFHGADGHVENNVFQNVANTAATDTNNAISAGADSGNTSEITSVRNYFYNVSHAYLAKEGSFITSTNNTLVGALSSVMNFHEPGLAASPGLGATIDGDIYFNAPTLFQNLNAVGTTTQLSVSRSVTPGASAYPGTGNTNADPRLTKTAAVTNPRVDFKLLPGSPAVGAGPNGLDMGALVSSGASISGEPPTQTSQISATLVVGGPGITSYKYRLNGGAWSAEAPVATPISLSGLANGTYTVQVAGRNSAGIWQADAAATTSKTWTVNSALSRLIINEVLANNTAALSNNGTFPDAIELYNAGSASINLQGLRLSDTSATPGKYVFPAGFSLAPGQYLVLYADSAGAAPGTHVGFSLNAGGEGVFLYNSVANGGALLDSVVFGQQAANWSIGRVGSDQHWALNTPTFGAANVEARTGNPATLKLNEWLATNDVKLTTDFLELYNPDTLPVALGGLYLSDNPALEPTKHQIAPLSFIAGSGFVAFIADNKPTTGPDHLSFALSSNEQLLALFDSSLNQIDKEFYFTQTTDYSQGPSPDGGITYAFYKLPTPGLSNSTSSNVQGLALIDNLRITEIMYNPLGSANTEYVELRNNGASSLDLTGVRLTSGIDFVFPAMNLAAGAYVLVVADIAAFQSRYGTGLNIAGQYTGSLSNSGEELLLELPNPIDVGVLRFDYSDAWYPSTDGLGNSLAINSATALAGTWDQRASWHASGLVGGSPGLLDPATTAGLTGHVTRDLNADGLQDVADPAISGMTVSVYHAGANGQIGGGDDVLVRTGTSDNVGDYSFFGLASGPYYLQFTPLGGYGFTLRDQGADDTLDSDVDPVTGRTNVFALGASQYDTTRDVGLTLTSASVVDRKLFYNNSSFDGNNTAANASDDAAIAIDKTALLGGSTATFNNYSSYSRGINGIMVDIQGLAGTPVASDFIFKVGNNSSPSGWALAPAPQSITVRAGAGTADSSRVELVWADGAIKNTWLQVTVKAGSNTGLVQNDVFFFGNAVGESGSTPGSAQVNSTDEIQARTNARTFLNPAAVTFAYDFNRDGLVNATDQILARSNSTSLAAALQLISPAAEISAPAALPAAASSSPSATPADAAQMADENYAAQSAATSTQRQSAGSTERDVQTFGITEDNSSAAPVHYPDTNLGASRQTSLFAAIGAALELSGDDTSSETTADLDDEMLDLLACEWAGVQ